MCSNLDDDRSSQSKNGSPNLHLLLQALCAALILVMITLSVGAASAEEKHQFLKFGKQIDQLVNDQTAYRSANHKFPDLESCESSLAASNFQILVRGAAAGLTVFEAELCWFWLVQSVGNVKAIVDGLESAGAQNVHVIVVPETLMKKRGQIGDGTQIVGFFSSRHGNPLFQQSFFQRMLSRGASISVMVNTDGKPVDVSITARSKFNT